MIFSAKAMKGLLVVLATLTIVAALFVGGCGTWGIVVYLDSLWRGVQGRYRIPEMLGLVGIIALPTATVVLGANVLLLWNIVRSGRLRSALLMAVAATDFLAAIGAFLWLASFGFLDFSWLLSLGAGLLALKGLGCGVLAFARRSSVRDAGPTSL